ncbi:hypothetical protein SASPL_150399 [Salvia splendens]|uniref:Uncharacterized protein n=1 Tax=Salvia splendens TaxID=180675 RepID=A0A8X8Z1Q7_SALSN|nr:hypothetical protein SASPL_150399 [Salvia splendens]
MARRAASKARELKWIRWDMAFKQERSGHVWRKRTRSFVMGSLSHRSSHDIILLEHSYQLHAMIVENKKPKKVALPEIRLINLLPTVPQIVVSDDDLAQLSYLNEPSVLHNLCVDITRKYTLHRMAGPVLLSVNSFKNVQLYGDDAAFHAMVAELKWIRSDMTLCNRDVIINLTKDGENSVEKVHKRQTKKSSKETESVKKAKNVADNDMARRAASKARDLKWIRWDMAFMQQRSGLLEEENMKLRDGHLVDHARDWRRIQCFCLEGYHAVHLDLYGYGLGAGTLGPFITSVIRQYVNPFKNFQLYGDDAAYHALVAELKWIISDMTLCKRDVGVPALWSTTHLTSHDMSSSLRELVYGECSLIFRLHKKADIHHGETSSEHGLKTEISKKPRLVLDDYYFYLPHIRLQSAEHTADGYLLPEHSYQPHDMIVENQKPKKSCEAVDHAKRLEEDSMILLKGEEDGIDNAFMQERSGLLEKENKKLHDGLFVLPEHCYQPHDMIVENQKPKKSCEAVDHAKRLEEDSMILLKGEKDGIDNAFMQERSGLLEEENKKLHDGLFEGYHAVHLDSIWFIDLALVALPEIRCWQHDQIWESGQIKSNSMEKSLFQLSDMTITMARQAASMAREPMWEDSVLLLRGFDSLDKFLSHLSNNLETALEHTITMARRAASKAREPMWVRWDMAFMQERSGLLEEENKKLRDGLIDKAWRSRRSQGLLLEHSYQPHDMIVENQKLKRVVKQLIMLRDWRRIQCFCLEGYHAVHLDSLWFMDLVLVALPEIRTHEKRVGLVNDQNVAFLSCLNVQQLSVYE